MNRISATALAIALGAGTAALGQTTPAPSAPAGGRYAAGLAIAPSHGHMEPLPSRGS